MKELIKEILVQNKERKPSLNLILRDQKLVLDLHKIQAIIGPRRVGKTSTLFLGMEALLLQNKATKDQILYFNFEDERLNFQVDSLDLILQGWKELHPHVQLEDCHFYFDEVQAVDGWEKFLNRINESLTKKICFTGSNSRVLHREVNTVLRGRSIALEILPLSFQEYCLFKAHKPELYGEGKSKTINLFHDYLKNGGYPELTTLESDTLQVSYLQEYYNAMLLRDIIEYNQVSNFNYLRSLYRMAASSISKPISIRRMYNQLKSMGYSVGLNSVYNMMNFAEDAYLFKRINRYDHSSSKSEKSDKKIYWIDNGLLRALTGLNWDSKGVLLENVVFLQLYRWYGSIYQSTLYYYSDQSHECDFIVERIGDSLLPIQVCWTMQDLNTRDREIKGILKACSYCSVKFGLIITAEERSELDFDGVKIHVLPAWQFLLGSSATPVKGS